MNTYFYHIDDILNIINNLYFDKIFFLIINHFLKY